MTKKKGGRPRKIDKDVLQKLEDAFSNAFPDDEACLYAGIHPRTLYNYQTRHPEFIQRKQALKLHPNMAARQTIVKALSDPKVAQWYLEKKDPEYKPASKVEHSGQIAVKQIIGMRIIDDTNPGATGPGNTIPDQKPEAITGS